ncbi:phosphoribosyl-AMP cyclohydrolase [Parvularcula sp. ZS-1/3]|uniref:Phosphoribosyl-AMP cyclohydrolase n=1 Tax=Parvularcula mediterranea TaxID=2732508 RepID=A0A7Y3W614_9PROT|nr:phosphoribosyl-AMP cyclohydrolase [Parvularcula mediterranea]NNU16836.1 phosphoribosyl-AMP cyclohydrolase [Parvularcula mediterranea]
MKALIPAAAVAGAFALSACATETNANSSASGKRASLPMYSDQCITEQEVVEAQQAWGDGIVKIGQVYRNNGDYVKAAADHINKFYGYDQSLVLFKPTLASVDQFRASFDGALSYFVNNNESYPEDKGFALRPWTNVRWENAGITNNSCTMAVAMGNYFFTPADGSGETKVEYTIGYIKDAEGDLRMVVHKSSLPYDPA